MPGFIKFWAEDHARIDASIGLLQEAIRIRAALHSGVQGELTSRYRSLGLAYPPTNYGEAWVHVRSRVAWAIRSIRQAVERYLSQTIPDGVLQRRAALIYQHATRERDAARAALTF